MKDWCSFWLRRTHLRLPFADFSAGQSRAHGSCPLPVFSCPFIPVFLAALSLSTPSLSSRSSAKVCQCPGPVSPRDTMEAVLFSQRPLSSVAWAPQSCRYAAWEAQGAVRCCSKPLLQSHYGRIPPFITEQASPAYVLIDSARFLTLIQHRQYALKPRFELRY